MAFRILHTTNGLTKITHKKATEDANEAFYDKLETTMFGKTITNKDTPMLIWLSKIKMKHRGYVEKQEQEITVYPLEEVMKRVAIRKKGDE